jgi:hypothetical protein
MATLAPESLAHGEAVLQDLAIQIGVSAAVDRLLDYRNQYRPTSNPRFWGVIDFDRHSSQPRLFVLDWESKSAAGYLCAHGRGSDDGVDDGYAKRFSNEDGSHCSSLGIYRTGDTYYGGHGKSLYLDGLEATNFNARHRHIVMHSASYVSSRTINSSGRIGRSQGCPAVEVKHIETLIGQLRGGSLIVAFKS